MRALWPHLYWTCLSSKRQGTRLLCLPRQKPAPWSFWGRGKRCLSKMVNAIELEDAIWKDIETFLRNPTDVVAQLAQQLHLQQGEEEQLYAELARQQLESQRLEKEKDSVITLFRKGRIDESSLDRQLDQIQLDEANIQTELEDIQERLQSLQGKVEGLRYAQELLQRLSERLEQTLTWNIKRDW